MIVPDIDLRQLVCVMDRFGLKSQEVRQRWRDAWHWAFYEIQCYSGGHGLSDAVYLRLVAMCEQPGHKRECLLFAAAELAAQYSQKR